MSLSLKPADLKNFVFDWELCFRLGEVNRFQNLVGLELPIKHTHKFSGCKVFSSGAYNIC